MTGKEAALFISSGTMGNLLATLCHCRERGAEFICGDSSHIYLYEAGGSATLASVHSRGLKNQPDGTIDLDDIRGAIRHEDPHYPVTRMIALETTHNRKGGKVLTLEYIDAVADIARAHKLALHMDGARIFNAAAALDVDVARIVKNCDSVTFCLSKALGAPAGSMLCGSKEFIYHAHRWRKTLGGGMRQVRTRVYSPVLSKDSFVTAVSACSVRAGFCVTLLLFVCHHGRAAAGRGSGCARHPCVDGHACEASRGPRSSTDACQGPVFH